jgi:hypothetical protein
MHALHFFISFWDLGLKVEEKKSADLRNRGLLIIHALLLKPYGSRRAFSMVAEEAAFFANLLNCVCTKILSKRIEKRSSRKNCGRPSVSSGKTLKYFF